MTAYITTRRFLFRAGILRLTKCQKWGENSIFHPDYGVFHKQGKEWHKTLEDASFRAKYMLRLKKVVLKAQLSMVKDSLQKPVKLSSIDGRKLRPKSSYSKHLFRKGPKSRPRRHPFRLSGQP